MDEEEFRQFREQNCQNVLLKFLKPKEQLEIKESAGVHGTGLLSVKHLSATGNQAFGGGGGVLFIDHQSMFEVRTGAEDLWPAVMVRDVDEVDSLHEFVMKQQYFTNTTKEESKK